MCVSPIKIPNPYKSSRPFVYTEGHLSKCSRRFVSDAPYISVPCGKCADCRASYFESIRQRVIVESLTSYVYFVTLTYDNKHLPTISFTSSCGEVNVYYADISHVQSMFKRLRSLDYLQDRQFRYLAVTEYGTSKFRPHHHILLFVSRKDTDLESTPFILEKKLYEDIKRFYALNRGTRKHPLYEPLFEYHCKMVNSKLQSNYSCSLVVDKNIDSKNATVVNTPDSISKVITYLVSYVNKTSRYDSYVTSFLDEFKQFGDKIIYDKLCRLLKTQTYYSKHLGFGFDNGRKVCPSSPNFICTEQMVQISEDLANLPDSVTDLAEYYPTLYRNYCLFKSKVENILNVSQPIYFNEILSKFTNVDDYLHLCMATKYDKDWLSTVTLNLNNLSDYNIRLLPKSVYETTFKSSTAYKFIRKYVEDGFNSKVEYLAFYDFCSSIPCFKPLCRYYKRYCTTLADTERLYNMLKVKDFDDYVKRIEFNMQNYERRVVKQSLNDAKEHISIENIPMPYKNIALYLHNSKSISIFAPTARSIDEILTI